MATIDGTDASDFIEGTEADDRIVGRGGDDEIYGYGGADRIVAGDGEDEVHGGDGDDRITGGDGIDVLYGEDGRDRLFGDASGDLIRGGNGGGLLDGGDGDDTLRGGDGVDIYRGGAGYDTLSFFLLDATQGVTANLAKQRIRDDGFGNVDRMSSIEALAGGTVFADRYVGSDGDNAFTLDRGDRASGLGGDDTFFIFSFENARVSGGDGSDTLSFLDGAYRRQDDGRIVVVARDRGVVVDLSEGLVLDDGLSFSGSIADFENVTGSGKDDRIRGSAIANRLGGGFGDDRIFGGAGDDIISGSGGDDRLNGGGGRDMLISDGGYDIMRGGRGVDTFGIAPLYSDLPQARDTYDHGLILDFDQASGEKIDLSAIPASDVPLGLTFHFIGTAAFDAMAQVRYEIVDGRTVIQLNTNSDRAADQIITLDGIYQLQASDFVF